MSSTVSTAEEVGVGSTVPSSSTTSSSTTSTVPFEYDSFTVLGAFPLQRLTELSIRVEVDAGDQNVYVPASAGNCFGTVAGAEVSYESNGVFRIDFRPLPRRYAQTQVVLACHYSTQEPNGAAAWKFDLVSAIAVGGEEQKGTTAVCVLQYDDRNRRLKLESHHFCGDAVVDETVTSVDALKVLRAAIGLESCMLNRCDTDTSGAVTAADALRTLHFAVGKAVSMLCSGCAP